MLISSTHHTPETTTKKRGRRRAPLPPDAPLYARKMIELLDVLGWPSDKDFGDPIGVAHDEVWKWHRGRKPLTYRDQLVIAHRYGVPCAWWDEPGVPLYLVLPHRRRREDRPTNEQPEDAQPASPDLTVPDLHGIMERWKAELDTTRKLLRKQMRADVREMCAEVQEMLQQVLARK